MEKNKSKGITLIALITTIIVMLILVAIGVAVVINSGILEIAQDASDKTENAYKEDSKIVDKIDLVIAIAEFNNTESDEYTEESYNEYQEAAEIAQQVRGKKSVTQEEVDAALEQLIEARDNLEEI